MLTKADEPVSLASMPDSSPETSKTQGNQAEEKPEAPPRDITGWRWFLSVTAILSSIFLYSLDVTVVADIQPVIIQEFGQVEKLTWLSVAFLLGATATNLIWGRIYSQFNTKWFYLLNVFLFEVGSAICAAAPSMNVMILGRAICGVGGSGLYVGVMTLLAATTTMRERPLYIGGTGTTWGLGIILGPIIGGSFSDSDAGWPWAFWINLIIGGLFAPVYIFLLPNKDPRPGVSVKDRAKEMDYVGSLLQMGALVAFVLAVSWGGLVYPWGSSPVIGLFVASGVLFALLGIQQVFLFFTTVSRRIIPIEFFASRTVLILFATTAASGACAFVPIYMIPIFFQFTRNDKALEAGVRLLPFIILMIIAIFTNGALLAKFGYYMPWYTAGGLFAVAGSALMYTVDQTTSISRIYGYTVLIGLGAGLFIQASFSVAQAVVKPAHVASAVGFITLAQFMGITISLAIANSLFLNGSQTKISRLLPDVPLQEIKSAMQGAGSRFFGELDPNVRAELLDAIVGSISETYILVIAGGALVAVLSLLMKREKLFAATPGMMA